MAEAVLDLRGVAKTAAYAELLSTFNAIVDGIDDPIARMATLASLVHHAFGHLWTGFYRVVAADLLRVGPYQGTLGCLEIARGRGVCGTAFAERRTIIVDDVHAHANHITCDARSRSEIVAPVFDAAGTVIAVFDIDSDTLARFDADDAAGIEALLRAL